MSQNMVRLHLDLHRDAFSWKDLPRLVEAITFFEPARIGSPVLARSAGRGGQRDYSAVPLDKAALTEVMRRGAPTVSIQPDTPDIAAVTVGPPEGQMQFWKLSARIPRELWRERRDDVEALVDWSIGRGLRRGFQHDEVDSILQQEGKASTLEALGADLSRRTVVSAHPILGKLVDVEEMPGHRHGVEDLWMDPFMVTLWSAPYWRWIAPERLARFDRCVHNRERAPGVREIVLWDDPGESGTPEAQDRMWALRRHVGVCEIGHGRYRGAPPPLEDPHLEILEDGLPDGVLRRLRYYVDAEGRAAPRSAAAGHEDYDVPAPPG